MSLSVSIHFFSLLISLFSLFSTGYPVTLTSVLPRHPSLTVPLFSSPFPSRRPLFDLPLFIHFSLFALMRLTVCTHRGARTHIPKQKTRLASLWGAVNVGLWIDPSSGFRDAKLRGGAALASRTEASVCLDFYQMHLHKAARSPGVKLK